MTETYEEYVEVKLNGRLSYLFDKDRYCYKKGRGKAGSFECEEKSDECPCKINACDGKILWRSAQHNHMPSDIGWLTKLTLSDMWHAAVETERPIKELVEQTLAPLPIEVVAELPEADRIKASLQAARRAANAKNKKSTTGNTSQKQKTNDMAGKAEGKPKTKKSTTAGRKRKQVSDGKENNLPIPIDKDDSITVLEEELERQKLEDCETPQKQINRELFPNDMPPTKKYKSVHYMDNTDSD